MGWVAVLAVLLVVCSVFTRRHEEIRKRNNEVVKRSYKEDARLRRERETHGEG